MSAFFYSGNSEDHFSKQSVWKPDKGERFEFYCPSCRVRRVVPFRSRPGGVRQVFRLSLTTAIFMIVLWSWLSWKGVLLFLPFWAVFELVYRLRMRAELSCPKCGFDPYLYLVDVDKARKSMEKHWRAKFAEKGIPYPGDETAEQEEAEEAFDEEAARSESKRHESELEASQ